MQHPRPRITVLGAAGFLGLNLVDQLAATGLRARCGHRRRSNVIPLRRRGLPRVAADLDDPASLATALADSDVVYHVAGHYPRNSLDATGIIATGRRQMRAVLDACAAAGVRRLIYVSSTATVAPNPDGGPSTEAHRFDRPPGFGPYHDLKWWMEQAALDEDRFKVVVACPSACLGPWDLKVGTAALLVATARTLDPPHPDGRVNLVDVRDVALALVALGTAEVAPRRLLLSGHSRRLHPFLVDLARRYQVAPPQPALDAAAARALADAEEQRVVGTPDRARLVREIVDLVVHAVPLDTRLAVAATDVQWTPLADTLDAFDAWARRMRRFPNSPTKERPMSQAMDRKALFELMRDAIVRVAPVRPDLVEEGSHLRDDLGLDSVASMELLSLLDEDLGLELEMEDVLGIETVGGFMALANARLAAAP